ncbi:MAG: phosphonate ABC transporter, permease protein PhnE [Solobacterium sp.]|nr:phosphonate ABC transporter, permease protein PhnE [Solobacterium sp.]MDY4640798.1 phosphonate ABC transporter, permease protein PhnE [Erysipelotrichaceae bacterium]MDD5842700.1 phosphonate ABC transporter, permease protein PhnE [Solobacterium sp.]MDD5982453.1 phosphonate ABC transporter, permease protein PhnE [Solobacterium sp.]MDD6497252.1 phosphonate ABC transporter, permease protein PhnE [Solobacterium sp.]
MKDSLFDRIFKPEVITLDNGHEVKRPKSKMPLIIICLVIVLAFSIRMTGFDLGIIVKRFAQLGVILGKIFHPDFSFLPKVIGPLIDTIKMSLLGTIIGCTLALPIAILSSSNINKNKILLSLCKFLLAIVRTLPTIIIATIAALIFSLGTFAGTVAITIFTFGVVGKMLFESIETIDMGPFEAMESFGANKFEAFWSACIPQIFPTYLSHCLYCFEMNIRAASILGYVGAGGLGLLINERIGWRDYNSLGTVLLVLFIAVVLVDFLSTYFRKKLG